MNRALHCNWIWRYWRVDDFLWEKVVEVRWGALAGKDPLEIWVDHMRRVYGRA